MTTRPLFAPAIFVATLCAALAAPPRPRPRTPAPPLAATLHTTPPAAASGGAGLDSSTHPNASAITAAYMRDVLFFLSADVMEGRNTPSRGLDTAALYIASNLAHWGLIGAGDPPPKRDPKLGPLAPFLYHYGLQRGDVNPAASHVSLNGRSFTYGVDFTSTAVAAGGSGPLLFVGNGYVLHKQALNPYRGLDLRGKILVVDGEPAQLLAYQSALLSYYQAIGSGNGGARRPVNPLGLDGIDYLTPLEYAAAHGALAVINGNLPDIAAAFAHIPPSVSSPAAALANPYPTPPPNVPSMQVTRFLPPDSTTVPDIVAGKNLWRELQLVRGQPTLRLSFSISADIHRARSEDVVALLPGSDPVLSHQYVVLSAHLDHLGIGPAVNGDDIYNGADDDGSGSTGLLNLAKAYAAGPRPKRSLLFIWHSGEEEGLWGSLYFTRFPTIPLHQVIAEINMDMIGRSKPRHDHNPADVRLTGPHAIYVIGPEISSSDLEDTLDQVNSGYYRLKLNHYYDRTNDPERIFYRSDHFNYAAHGIPILFFFDGIHVDYHRPGDEPPKIDYAKMQTVVRTVYAVGWRLANQPQPPRLNPKLPAALIQAMAQARRQDREDALRFHPSHLAAR